jgi:hypothetical protein
MTVEQNLKVYLIKESLKPGIQFFIEIGQKYKYKFYMKFIENSNLQSGGHFGDLWLHLETLTS